MSGGRELRAFRREIVVQTGEQSDAVATWSSVPVTSKALISCRAYFVVFGREFRIVIFSAVEIIVLAVVGKPC